MSDLLEDGQSEALAKAIREAMNNESIGMVAIMLNKLTGGMTVSLINCDERIAASVLVAAQAFIEQSVSTPNSSIN